MGKDNAKATRKRSRESDGTRKQRKLRQKMYALADDTKAAAAEIANPTSNQAAKHLRRGKKLEEQACRPLWSG